MIPPSNVSRLVKWARSKKIKSIGVTYRSSGGWQGVMYYENKSVTCVDKTEAGVCVALFIRANKKFFDIDVR